MKKRCLSLIIICNLLPTLAAAEYPTAQVILSQQRRADLRAYGPWPPTFKADTKNQLSGNAAAIDFGKRLFFSTRLSGDNQKSCTSCHAPNDLFASGRLLKENPALLERDTPSLLNVRYQQRFGWDGRGDNLWTQSIRPILSRKEMSLPKSRLRSVIRESTFRTPYYELFGDISEQPDDQVLMNIGKALAAFQETLVSASTPFDQWLATLTTQGAQQVTDYPLAAQRGLSLFVGRGQCSTCHAGPLFSSGQMYRTSDGAAKFRVPSLRNVSKTAPYLHDGSVTSLEVAINHPYIITDKQVPRTALTSSQRPNFTKQERNDLLAFLLTLTNTSLQSTVYLPLSPATSQ